MVGGLRVASPSVILGLVALSLLTDTLGPIGYMTMDSITTLKGPIGYLPLLMVLAVMAGGGYLAYHGKMPLKSRRPPILVEVIGPPGNAPHQHSISGSVMVLPSSSYLGGEMCEDVAPEEVWDAETGIEMAVAPDPYAAYYNPKSWEKTKNN